MGRLTRLWAHARRSAFARDTAVLTLGAAAAQALALLVVPLLSRLYAPSAFGLLAAFGAVASIVAITVTLRYETAVVLPRTDAESRAVLGLALALALGLGLVATGAAWALHGHLAFMAWAEQLGPWLPVAVATGVATALIAAATAWFSRQRAYGLIAGVRIGQSALVALVGLALGWLGGPGGPGEGDATRHGLMVAQGVGVVAVAACLLPRLGPVDGAWTASGLAAAARQHRAAPTLLLPTALMDTVSLQLPILLILSRLGGDEAGQYAMATRILGLPAALLGAAAGQVFYERVSAQVHLGIAPVRQAFQRVSLTLAAVALLPTVVLAVWGAPLFAFVLGPSWREAGVMAEVLVFSTMMYFVFAPTSSLLIVLRRPAVLLGFGAWQLAYRVAIAAWAPDVHGYIRVLVGFELLNVLMFVAAVLVCLHQRRDPVPA